MKTISDTTCGIKALEGVLNRIVAAVNARTIETGAGLTKSENPDGIIISLANQDKGDSNVGGGGGGGGGGSGLPGNTVLQGMKTLDIDVMDHNCIRSTIQVLVYTGNPADTVPVFLVPIQPTP